MTPIAQALSAALLHFVWQGLLVAFSLWIALFLLKNRSANARYLASSVALAALALLPPLTTWILYRRPGTLPEAASFATTVWPAAVAIPHAAAAQIGFVSLLQAWALPLWGAGVFVFSFRLVWGCSQVAGLRRAGEPADGSILAMAAALRAKLGLFRTVSIVITSQSDGPSVVGWLRPAILLPAATLLGLTAQQLEAVLAHEFAHIRRHDYLVNLLQNLVETLLFYHPAVWWTSARMRHERELCCDDLAVHSCGDAICYARALTTLEKMRGAGMSLAMGSTGGSLLYRIQRLMGLRPRLTSPSRVPALAALLMGVACLALNMNWARAQEKEKLQLVERPGVLGFVSNEDSPGVTVDLGGATVAERVGVEYPGSAWENKIGGIVVVEATLDAQGGVSDARVLNGPAELRKAALQSILEWRFALAPAGTTRQISINFNWEQAEVQRQPGTVVVFQNKEHALRLEESSETTRFLEEELQAAVRDNADPAKVADLQKKMDAARQATELEKVSFEIKRQAESQSGQTPSPTVSRIRIRGLSELQQKQLAERLPVHLGDVLTPSQQQDIVKAVSEFNPLLKLGFSQDDNGHVVITLSMEK